MDGAKPVEQGWDRDSVTGWKATLQKANKYDKKHS